ncbi:Methyltransferase-like protein 7B [Habropoda laboriosa]|uniref:Methyltransferase-like protein 7B n=1 Tax=Habropoda laboriosa TaxID=597456 RepID=A0A0L7QK95_9HYME|nr:PREDICTED: methyltransferase-like protein 7B [Habropoda laboriosa]KOC58946.1 Methyltransferase-like protein 7B [Habropoda laboriosa]
MSNSDVWMRDVITSYGLLSAVLVLVIILLLRKWSSLQKSIYKAYLTGFEVECAELSRAYKKQLFKPLEHVVSCDKVLQSMGCIRLLEIGVKTGENIQFYPENTRWIGVDRNVRLGEYLTTGHRFWPFSRVIIERVIVGDGSSLKEVPTACVDVVVTTRTLCSVTSIQSTLREIHRVLTPGGQYLFIEHIPENEGTFIRWIQKILSQTGIWPSLFGGCCLNINPIEDIKNTGFNHITWDTFTLGGDVSQPFHLILSKQHILGMAVR